MIILNLVSETVWRKTDNPKLDIKFGGVSILNYNAHFTLF
jgi:hypothetical protein